MPQVTTAFTPDFVTTMRRAVDAATDRVPVPSRTPATKAKMAQRIVRSAHEGITDPQHCQRDGSDQRGHVFGRSGNDHFWGHNVSLAPSRRKATNERPGF
jgi:hypothetical protein